MYTNSFAVEELETLEDMMEELEYDEMYDDESDESDWSERTRRRMMPRRRMPTPRTAPGSQLYRPRPTSQYVTQPQLQAALARVGSQIKTNADAIKTNSNRINAVSAEQTRQVGLLRKEVSERKKQGEMIKQDTRQKLELLALLPALSRPPAETITVRDRDNENPRDVRVLTESNDSLSLLLPLLLVGGLGGLGGSGTGSGGSDSSTMLLLVLALSGGLGGRR
ncbi:hypothetical protein C7B76_17275 [filamentous cyanobacterium CCP2]|nr:hypothetical protein C7B76_17275 [filamentous cyanobacterium CCP2]